MPNRGEKDGKGVGGHEAYVKQMMKIGVKVIQLEQAFEAMSEDNVHVHTLKFLSRGSDDQEWLVVLGVDTEAGAKVAFSSAATLSEALQSLCNRLRNNTIRWKADEYRNK